MNASFRVSNSSDGESGILNFDVVFLKEILREQLRIKVYTQGDTKDKRYSHLLLSTPIETCKLNKGIFTTIVQRVVMENYFNSLNNNLTCPFAKNSHHKLTNCKITDHLIPPLSTEKLFKYETSSYGMLRGQRGWKNLYYFEIYGRVKK